MITVLNSSNVTMDEILARKGAQSTPEIEAAVAQILQNVRQNGDDALREYSQRFDGVTLTELRVPQAEIDEAYATADKEFVRTLEMAADNIRRFHEKQLSRGYTVTEQDGVVLGQKVTPVGRAGLYVPGGTAAYPSTVLMDAVPAKVAGVREVVMVTPPSKNGSVNPAILTAAKVAGVTAVYKVGGAQAIAALAYGTQTIPRVDKIVGPGNIYVATAKRQVFGLVGIDMVAGPSEILVLADAAANPAFVAADLLSQAEHDKLASAVLVCDSPALAQAVSDELERQIPLLPRAEIARASIDNNGKIIVAQSLSEGVDIANAIAPEHMEICTDDPFAYLSQIQNAGSIFLGKHVPEALGDYFAGTNHTLPTGGTARFSNPLGVDDFMKKSSYIYYSREALGAVQHRIADFAEREGLQAHANSVTIRFQD